MSKLKPNPRLKPVATVKVKTRALLAQGGGEVFHAHGCSENAVRAAQSSILDGDVSALKLLHRNKDGRVVGTTTYTVPTVDADAEVSVVDRDGQSGLRAISQKMEAVVAHSVQQAKRKGWSSEARFVVTEGRDTAEVMRRHGLCDGEPFDFDGETYVNVSSGRVPGAGVEVQRARRKGGTS